MVHGMADLDSGLGYFFDSIAGSQFGAPVFMLCMGIGITYSRKNDAATIVKRDLKINSLTRFDKKRNKIFTMFHDDQNQLVMYEYEVLGKGKIHLVHHTLDNYNSGVR